MKYTILTMSRGDEHRIKEWVEYHASLGFNDFHFILDAPIDESLSVLKSLKVDADITVEVRQPSGDYYDGLTPSQRWEAVKKWRLDNAEQIQKLGLPASDSLSMRQYTYFPEVLEQYSGYGEGWLALIDVDEFIVFPGGQQIRDIAAATNSPRIRLLNFNFDMDNHTEGEPVLKQTMRWAREDIEAYGKGWENRVKTIARYDSLLPLASVHPISKGPFVTLDPEIGRLHHYKLPGQGIKELPYRVKDEAALKIFSSR